MECENFGDPVDLVSCETVNDGPAAVAINPVDCCSRTADTAATVAAEIGEVSATASVTKNKKFVFVPPPEAPVYHPSIEEFEDSLGYINKIKPYAEKYGICKIVPPKGWQPPFSLNVEKLRFKPRIQKINELDALSRIKLNFIDVLMKFWDLQGSPILKPTLDNNRTLDLYTLRKIVQDEGGYDEVCKKNLWTKVAEKIDVSKDHCNLLKKTYKSVIQPYEIYVSNNSELDFKMQKSLNNERKYTSKKNVTRRLFKDIKESLNEATNNINQKENVDNYLSSELQSKTACDNQIKKETKELRNLRFNEASQKIVCTVSKTNILPKKRESKSPKKVFDSVSSYNCLICSKDDKEDLLIICVKCNENCHTFCLKPALKEIPRGDWHCPRCLASIVRKMTAAFGFETSAREYSLQQFSEMADRFKCHYFRMQVHKVSLAAVEQEFWRIVSDIDERVVVEYGADLHSMDHGSGFPVKTASAPLASDLNYYAESSWNLNNLPILDGSVFGHINADISGMKIPWMYVGMCFSTFCWHNEDHWSYSINYLHWGEAKTWYGVPGDQAVKFEQVLRKLVPELFEAQADLLHQLVTIINPNLLSEEDVSIYRLDQQAGEFVITFPRSYHAGFNQGYNFAEAVNFAPSDWIQKGRECVEHYSELKRYCVFSHDELICKMALSVKELSYALLESLLGDFLDMITAEKLYRKRLMDQGVNTAERVFYELIPDNERMCYECKTTCFLSAIRCKCNNEKLYCLKHLDKVCKCPFSNYTLFYRYTMDELPHMITSINARLVEYRTWLHNAEEALNPSFDEKRQLYNKKDLSFFVQLVEQVHFWKNPKPEPLYAIKKIIQIAECCIHVIKQLKLSTPNQASSRESSLSSVDMVAVSGTEITELDRAGAVAAVSAADVVAEVSAAAAATAAPTSETTTATNLRIDTSTLNEKKLTYHEMKSFIEEIDALPCLIKEKKLLDEVFAEIENFRQAEMALYERSLDQVSLQSVEELYEKSKSLCIECSEIAAFYKRVLMHDWSKKLDKFRNDPNSLYLKDYYELVQLKRKLSDDDIGQDGIDALLLLEQTIDAGTDWEKRAKQFLKDKTKSFEQLIDLLEEAQSIKATLVYENDLLQCYENCDTWRKKIDEMYSRPVFPFCNLIHDMYVKGTKLPVHFKETDLMHNALRDSELWRKDLEKYFFLNTTSNSSNSSSSGGSSRKFNIFERLMPKTNYQAIFFAKNQTDIRVDEKFAPTIDNVKFGDLTDRKDILSVLKLRQKCELDFYRNIRQTNEEKLPDRRPKSLVGALPLLCCVCTKKINNFVLWCSLCRNVLHMRCTRKMPGKFIYRASNGHIGNVFTLVDKVLCGNCSRTEQPFLDNVVPLMERLENMQMRLPESELLHFVVDQAVEWRQKVQTFFHEPEIASWKLRCSHYIKQYVSDMCEIVQMTDSETVSLASNCTYKKLTSTMVKAGEGESDLKYFEVSLSSENRATLEKLIFAGDLMEFRTSETYKLWFLWNCLPNAKDHPVITLLMTIDTAVESNQPTKKQTASDSNKKPARTASPKPSIFAASLGGQKNRKSGGQKALLNSEPKVPKMTKQGQKNRLETNSDSDLQSGSEKEVGCESKSRAQPKGTRKKRTKKTPPPSRSKKRPKTKKLARMVVSASGNDQSQLSGVDDYNEDVNGDEDDDDDNDETNSGSGDEACAAPSCIEAPNSRIDWVQCDGGCEKWFHLHCLGLKLKDVKDIDDFICNDCTSRVSNAKCGINGASEVEDEYGDDDDDDDNDDDEVLDDTKVKGGRFKNNDDDTDDDDGDDDGDNDGDDDGDGDDDDDDDNF